MKRLSLDFQTVMSAIAVLGMMLAVAGTWPPAEGLSILRSPGLAMVYLAGGLPATWSALTALWRDHILDIDLLMVVAAVAGSQLHMTRSKANRLHSLSIRSMMDAVKP